MWIEDDPTDLVGVGVEGHVSIATVERLPEVHPSDFVRMDIAGNELERSVLGGRLAHPPD